MKTSEMKWFILLWLGGFLGLLFVAGIFKGLLFLSYH